MRKLGFSQKTLSLMTESQIEMILEKIKKKETKEATQNIETKTNLVPTDKFKEVTVDQIKKISKLENGRFADFEYRYSFFLNDMRFNTEPPLSSLRFSTSGRPRPLTISGFVPAALRPPSLPPFLFRNRRRLSGGKSPYMLM